MITNTQLELTTAEHDELTQCETVIERGLRTFVDVGNALLKIRDRRLYREDWGTFADYCRDKWGMVRRHADRMIAAALVVGDLGPMGPKSQARERQIRPLTQLSPDDQRIAWERAIETAPEGKITGAHVQRVVDEMRGTAQQLERFQRFARDNVGLGLDEFGDLLPQHTGASQPVEVTIFSHGSVEYYTPPQYVEAARQVMGTIDLDPATCEAAQARIGALSYYTEQDDGYLQPWAGRVWLNPPYSYRDGQSNQGLWSRRLVQEYEAGNVQQALLLVKAALGYNWFEDLWYRWPVCFGRERLSFIRSDGSDDGQSKQATAFFYFGPDVGKFKRVFVQFGRVILPGD